MLVGQESTTQSLRCGASLAYAKHSNALASRSNAWCELESTFGCFSSDDSASMLASPQHHCNDIRVPLGIHVGRLLQHASLQVTKSNHGPSSIVCLACTCFAISRMSTAVTNNLRAAIIRYRHEIHHSVCRACC